MQTKDFAKLLEPGLHAVWGLDYSQWPEEYSQVFTIETISNRNYIEDQSITGFGLVPEKGEGNPINYDTAYQGFVKKYTFTVYGLGFKVTREMWEDALYRQIKSLPKALSRSVKHTVEQLSANVLNNAFDSNYTGADGKELCSTAHPLVAGGTFSNKLNPSADLDITSFENALLGIQSFVDDRGLKLAAKPVRLIVHPNDAWMAEKILKSAQTPGTADNDYNPAKGILPKGYVVMHWLTDGDAWFVQTDVMNGLNFFWRRKPEFGKDNDFDSEIAKFKTTFRMDVGWTDPRAVYGSPGA